MFALRQESSVGSTPDQYGFNLARSTPASSLSSFNVRPSTFDAQSNLTMTSAPGNISGLRRSAAMRHG